MEIKKKQCCIYLYYWYSFGNGYITYIRIFTNFITPVMKEKKRGKGVKKFFDPNDDWFITSFSLIFVTG